VNRKESTRVQVIPDAQTRGTWGTHGWLRLQKPGYAPPAVRVQEWMAAITTEGHKVEAAALLVTNELCDEGEFYPLKP
jgi:hypothetical protein